MSFRLAIVSKVELWNFRNSSISIRFCYELHEIPSFASMTVHEEVDDLVDVFLLLGHDETCVGLLPFMIILITASLSSNTYNKAS